MIVKYGNKELLAADNGCVREIGSKDVQYCDEKMETRTRGWLSSFTQKPRIPRHVATTPPFRRLTKQPDPSG